MKFEKALKKMKKGTSITRKGWNGKNMFLAMEIPSKDSKMSLPFVYIKTAQGENIPWTASQSDLFAEDWEEMK